MSRDLLQNMLVFDDFEEVTDILQMAFSIIRFSRMKMF